MTTLRWKPILPFTGISGYEVSACGMVRNKSTKYVLKSRADSDGYLIIDVKGYTFKVHRLVALAFLPNPDKKPEVNHKDGCRYANWVDNLEWSTVSENRLHAYRVLGRKVGTERKILARGEYLTHIFESTKEAQRAGHNRAAIYLCLTGAQKHHHGFTWEYA